MQFNSYIFILAFLPITVCLYFAANRFFRRGGEYVIVCASVCFYSYADLNMLLYLLLTLGINYICSLIIQRNKWRKLFLAIPVLVNIGMLLYFKYFNFAILNVNTIFQMQLPYKSLIMPLGISFITFQQIAWLVSTYRNELNDCDLLDYLVYILYFPKLVMGPLMEPSMFLEQIKSQENTTISSVHIMQGIQLFSFGLAKKVLLADIFAYAVSWGFDNVGIVTSLEWILIMLFYTFQIYFDFSGYSDMATGVSLMLNIHLPINFDSPYHALSIRDFWKRWHISLTKFLTKYIYIPLGGSKKGKLFTYLNTMIVFLVSGIWHGANWTFILWGILHGILSIVDRMTDKLQKRIIEPARWICTFGIVNVLWLLFRSNSVSQWVSILKTTIGFQNTTVSDGLLRKFELSEFSFFADIFHLERFTTNIRGFWMLVFLAVAFIICLFMKNNIQKKKSATTLSMVTASLLMVWCILRLSMETIFVYFNF